jgi:hypothetical protein
MKQEYTAGQLVSLALPHLSDGQNLTPLNALAQLWETAELRTRVTPPVKLSILKLASAELGQQGGEASAVGPLLKPTLILTGPAGDKVVAPYGEAGGREGTVVLVGGALGLAGALVLAGYLLGRARRSE